MRTPSELKDMVREIEQPFIAAPVDAGDFALSIRDRMKALDNTLYSRHDYRKDISPLLANPVSVGPAALRYWRNRMVADLRNDLRIHLEPKGGLKRHETAADRMEVFESHTLLDLWGDGDIRENIHAIQAAGFFWAGWLEMEKYAEPAKMKDEEDADYNARCERHKRAFAPWRVVEKHPESVAFTESNRTLTYAMCRYKLPIIDIMERYGEVSRKDTGQMLKVYNESFSWIRADEPGKAENALDSFREEVEVIIVADGVTCSHFVDMGARPGRRDDARFRSLGDGDYDNPLGQVPLLVCEGVYNPYQPIPYRRESLLHSLINIEDAMSVLKSVWASKAASQPYWVELMPPEISHENAPPEMQLVIGDDGMQHIARSWATDVKLMDSTIDPNQDKLYQVFANEAQQVSPSGLLNSGEEASLAQAPSTTVLTQLDEAKSLMASATRSETRMWSRALDMVQHAMRHTLNDHRKKGEPKAEADWVLSFTTSGSERVRGRKVKYGEDYDISPQDYDIDFTRTMEPVDDRLSTQSALLGYWDARYRSGWATYDDTLEGLNLEDKDAFKEAKMAETLFQLDVPRVIKAQAEKYAAAESVLQGRPFAEVLGELAVDDIVQGVQVATGGQANVGAVTRQGSGVTNGIGPQGGSVSA